MTENVTLSVAPMRQRVAEEIRVLLARRRMSGSELARRIGATQPYMSRRLTGETAFDVDDLERIAGVLGVSVASLLPPASAARSPIDPEVSRRKGPLSPAAVTRPPNRTSPGRTDSRRPAVLRRPMAPVAS